MGHTHFSILLGSTHAHAGKITITPMISSFDDHTLLLNSDGTVWSVGNNSFGQLGIGMSMNRRPIRVRVPNLQDIIAVSAGACHSLALRADGTVWAWGDNYYGQLGNGTNVNQSTPIQIPGLTNVVRIEAGIYHSIAEDASGTLWAWGHNAYGNLGDNTTTNRWSPVQITY